MDKPVTILAPIKLAAGKTEADLLSASTRFQQEFVTQQPGVIRRELIRKAEGQYIDIVQFKSAKDAEEVMEKEKQSPACHAFFEIMDLTDTEDSDMALYVSLVTYP